MLHDVREDRPHYSDVFGVFDIVEAVGTLYHLKLKADVRAASVFSKFLAYQHDAR